MSISQEITFILRCLKISALPNNPPIAPIIILMITYVHKIYSLN